MVFIQPFLYSVWMFRTHCVFKDVSLEWVICIKWPKISFLRGALRGRFIFTTFVTKAHLHITYTHRSLPLVLSGSVSLSNVGLAFTYLKERLLVDFSLWIFHVRVSLCHASVSFCLPILISVCWIRALNAVNMKAKHYETN